MKSRSLDGLFVSNTLVRGRHRPGVVDTTLQTHSPAGSTCPLRSPLTASSLQISLQSCEHISRTTRAIFAGFSARLSHGRDSVLLWRCRDMRDAVPTRFYGRRHVRPAVRNRRQCCRLIDGTPDLHRRHTDNRLTAFCTGLHG